MPVLCGDLRSYQVRASSFKRKSKQVSRKSHTRSRCRKVANESMINALCTVSPKNRCVVASALAKRTKKGKRTSVRTAVSRYISSAKKTYEPEVTLRDCLMRSEDECISPCSFENQQCVLPSANKMNYMPVYDNKGPLVNLSVEKKKKSSHRSHKRKNAAGKKMPQRKKH